MMHPALAAMQELREALLRHDPDAVTAAAQRLDQAVRALERQPPPAPVLEALAACNRETGALLAARQAAVHWALTRIAGGGPQTYDRAGRHPVAAHPRRRASA
jgi:hypothetical protein